MEAPAATAIVAGLTSDEARRRLEKFGPNVPAESELPLLRRLGAKFWTPVPWLLELAIILQIGLAEYVEAAVITGLLVFNAVLALLQEERAGAALAAMKRRLAPTAQVCRDGVWSERPAAELVPDDVIRLSLGALVPADARIVSGFVTADQSMLTGEAAPVEIESGGIVYAGALVRRGQAMAVVAATGAKTYFGRAAELVRVAHGASTEQQAIRGVVRNLALVNGAVATVLVVIAYAIGLPGADLVRLALTALLASIPVALPATFTLSAAIGAQLLARHGVLLTRLSAAHEAAAMDVLCADKTGTLTRNEMTVAQVLPMPGFEPGQVLALAALASSEADRDPIDTAIRQAAAKAAPGAALGRPPGRVVAFTPFDPATRMSEAVASAGDGGEIWIAKGAFAAISEAATCPAEARRQVDAFAAQGYRVIAVATGSGATGRPDGGRPDGGRPDGGRPDGRRLAGLVALVDPPRADSAALIAALRDLGVRTVMITGDGAITAAAIARQVGINGAVCPAEQISDALNADRFDVFARVLPEGKYRLVQALQRQGHVVGMCGDGVNDAPALRQGQIGIAVSSATDVAKAAASMVMTEPGLAGIVRAVQEGRIAFQRLLAYTLNMVVKKTEIVLFLAVGLVLTGHPVMTPALMVLLLVTNDFLSMSLTTDRASPAPGPSVWRMQGITATGLALGVCKLGFSTAMLAGGKWLLGLGPGAVQTLAFVALVFGNQASLYALRERRHLWRTWPGKWVLAASAADLGFVSVFAISGILMEPLPWQLLAGTLVAAGGLALILDQVKLPVMAVFKVV